MRGVAETQAIERYQKATSENRFATKDELSGYGRTVGKPKLSDTAKKYYDELKKKFGDYDFVLVSKDEKDNINANASKYANGSKGVVLISEDEVEKMASDSNFAKKYEGIISDAQTQLLRLKEEMEKSGGNITGYGMNVNSDGSTSFFATIKKASALQKERIEKKQQEKKEESDIINASSADELLRKISDFMLEQRTNAVQTDSEKLIGQSIDFRG